MCSANEDVDFHNQTSFLFEDSREKIICIGVLVRWLKSQKVKYFGWMKGIHI